ncbi:hypothetical protein RRF57_010812 [Xylaria bambusicola]|uniref:Uncharacterized protein n=1 Tax=Xylaria bambusicola TaxID=326684 RepID=A0AAN7UXM9_9PEZI
MRPAPQNDHPSMLFIHALQQEQREQEMREMVRLKRHIEAVPSHGMRSILLPRSIQNERPNTRYLAGLDALVDILSGLARARQTRQVQRHEIVGVTSSSGLLQHALHRGRTLWVADCV